MGARIQSIFLVTVKSESLVLEGAIEDVVPIALAENTLGFRVEVHNAGNVHFYPKGQIELLNAEGDTVGQVNLPDTPPVYPGTTRAFELAGTIVVPPGDYEAVASVDYGWEPWQVELVDRDPTE